MDQDLRILYTEYTLAAADLTHALTEVIRYRNTILRAIEAPTKSDYYRITAALPELRARIRRSVDRFAQAGTHVSKSGRSEAEDVRLVRDRLEEYFASADVTIALMNSIWTAPTPEKAAEARAKAEAHAAADAGAKLVQVTLAVERLLDTVAEVGKELRDQAASVVRLASLALILGGLAIAWINLFSGWTPTARSGQPNLDFDRNRPVRERSLAHGQPDGGHEPDVEGQGAGHG
jgi:hypothetical protein